MYSTLIFVAVVSSALAGVTYREPDNVSEMYENFKIKYNKVHNSIDEDKLRFAIFRDNLKKAHDIQQENGASAEFGVTQFMDLTTEEFLQNFGGLDVDASKNELFPATHFEYNADELPESLDWREKNAVTSVDNQGHCGSCWSFSVTGMLEGQLAIKTGKLTKLSKRQLVDCETMDHGCKGGYPLHTYEAIKQMGGLETESEYPYTDRQEHLKCKMDKSKFVMTVKKGIHINNGEEAMAAWMVKMGPMSVAVNASPLHFYKSGIYKPSMSACNPYGLNHAVLAVGYGVENGVPYWIVKNSWAKTWGEKGYFRIHRGSGACGIDRMATSAEIQVL